MNEVVWFVAIEAPGRRAEWDWATLGKPDPRELLPVRQPSSGDFSRHIPVTAYSVKTQTHHELESSLEYELFRQLELRNDVEWIVAQPVRLHVAGRRVSHTPDLLSLHRDGTVTIWDARPRERADDLFDARARLTRGACRAVGWNYEVHHGASSTAERLNGTWLHPSRRADPRFRPWYASKRADLCRLLSDGGLTIGEIVDAQDDELTSAMWHCIWTGDIACDLREPLRMSTRLTWVAAHA